MHPTASGDNVPPRSEHREPGVDHSFQTPQPSPVQPSIPSVRHRDRPNSHCRVELVNALTETYDLDTPEDDAALARYVDVLS